VAKLPDGVLVRGAHKAFGQFERMVAKQAGHGCGGQDQHAEGDGDGKAASLDERRSMA
jgi:hypothetical protein